MSHTAAMRRWGPWVFALMVGLACAATLRPFWGAIVWGLAIAVACEPVVERFSRWTSSRASAALIVMTALALAVALPLGFAIASAASQIGWAIDWAREAATKPWPAPPAWALGLPLVGDWLARSWETLSKTGAEAALALGKNHAGAAAAYAATAAGSVGAMAIHAGLTLFVAGLAVAKSAPMVKELSEAGRAVFGPRAGEWIELAASAIRGVALGVVGTALLLTVAVAAGLAAVEIPAVSLLACATMILCLAQIGPLPILAPAVAYLAMSDRYGAAVFIAILTVILSVVDGLLRPYLIGREIKMPMLWIFAGVVGGLIAFGMLGLFIGPMALAMGRKLWLDWRSGHLEQMGEQAERLAQQQEEEKRARGS